MVEPERMSIVCPSFLRDRYKQVCKNRKKGGMGDRVSRFMALDMKFAETGRDLLDIAESLV
jgi:hypothetical protein